jgi:hypothetical protein
MLASLFPRFNSIQYPETRPEVSTNLTCGTSIAAAHSLSEPAERDDVLAAANTLAPAPYRLLAPWTGENPSQSRAPAL